METLVEVYPMNEISLLSMSLPDPNTLTESDAYKLVDFYRAYQPHEPALNNIQLRMIHGKPKPQVSPCNVKGIHKLFLDTHYMCGGKHKLFQW